MALGSKWDGFTAGDWRTFAISWLASLRKCSSSGGEIGQTVVMMNFTATPEQQWQFIMACIEQASSDAELEHIAAGPLEHLLGWYGDKYIDVIEQESKRNPLLARTLALVRKYLMKDEVWERVQAVCRNVSGS